MTKTKKTILAIVTVLPIFFFAWYLFATFSFFQEVIHTDRIDLESPDASLWMMKQLFLPIFGLFLLSIGLIVFYLIDIYSWNHKLRTDAHIAKFIWVMVILFGNSLGMLVYFILEIYPRQPMDHSNEDHEMV